MKRILPYLGLRGVAAGIVLAIVLPHFSSAQILMSGGTYSQNFDSLANSGTSNPWTDNSTLTGWYASKQLGGAIITAYRADNGSGNTGALYSYGATASANRAFGVLVSSTPGNIAFGLRFTNDTAFIQTNILISFTGEQWRSNNVLAQTLAFSYQIGNGLTNSDGANSLSWTNFSALNFTTPAAGGTSGTGMALDGTDAANQQTFTNVLLSGAAVQPGQELFLRWYFARPVSGSSHAVAIDNLTVSFQSETPQTNPPTIITQPQSQTVNAGDSATFTVVASGTAPLSYQWKSNNFAVAGATNNSFSIASVTTNLSGNTFFVTITNIAGSTNSQTATLTVNPVSTAANVATQNRILRIVTYNIEADVTNSVYPTWSSVGPPLPGLIAPPGNTNNFAAGGVLEGIGEEIVNGNAQPLDVLALEETTTNPVTVTPIVNALNTFYGVAGMYSNSSFQATEQFGDPTFGDGPNAIVYNTRTLQLLASTPIDPPGGTGQLGGISSGRSGMYREVMRYQFAPAGVATNAANIFYIYVSHYKSGDDTTPNNTNSRAGEAFIVRSNMMTTLPATARILHIGDFNTGDASESMYGILTASGTNQLTDPVNPSDNLTTNFDNAPINMTEAATVLQFRDDYQMMTTNVYYGISGGLTLVTNSYHIFGNNGSTPHFGTVNSGSNTSLNNRLVTNGPVFISTAQLLLDLTNASDHLPIVADYIIPIPVPQIANLNIAATNLILTVTNGITNANYTLLTSTNIASPKVNWTPVASNTASTGNFAFIATNAVSKSAPQQFYILQTR